MTLPDGIEYGAAARWEREVETETEMPHVARLSLLVGHHRDLMLCTNCYKLMARSLAAELLTSPLLALEHEQTPVTCRA